MIKKEIDYKNITLKCSSYISFLIELINFSFIFLLSILLTFGVSKPILNNSNFKKNEEILNSYKTELFRIGSTSKLMIYDESTNTVLDFNSTYRQYILENILYSYNCDDEIKNDLENIGFSSYNYAFTNIKYIDYSCDLIGYFYTSWIVDKKDSDGNNIVNYNLTNSKDYFLSNVLKIESDGYKYYQLNSDKELLPYFTKDTSRYFFEYYVKGVSYSTLRELDTSFYNYFKKIYKNAGDLLAKYSEYSSISLAYNNLYNEINKKSVLISVLIYFSSYFVYLIVYCICRFKTIGELIFHAYRLDRKKERSVGSNISYSIFNMFKFFVITPLITLFIGGSNAVDILLFKIGVITVRIMHIAFIPFLYLIISVFFLFLSESKRSLTDRISFSSEYKK